MTHDADERDAYDKSEGKHTFADFCLFFVRREVDKYLTDPYINSQDVYPIFPFCEQLSSFFFRQTSFVQTFCAYAQEGLIFYFAPFETLLNIYYRYICTRAQSKPVYTFCEKGGGGWAGKGGNKLINILLTLISTSVIFITFSLL